MRMLADRPVSECRKETIYIHKRLEKKIEKLKKKKYLTHILSKEDYSDLFEFLLLEYHRHDSLIGVSIEREIEAEAIRLKDKYYKAFQLGWFIMHTKEDL